MSLLTHSEYGAIAAELNLPTTAFIDGKMRAAQAGGQIVVDLENYDTGQFNGWCVAGFQIQAIGPAP